MVKVFSIAMATLVLLAGGTVVAASLDASNGQPLKGEAAFGGWRQDKPGERRLLTPQDLPPIGKSTASRSEVVPMPSGAKPEVPAGFSVELVASGIASPRAIRMAPNGDLFVADSAANAVRVFRIPAGSASRPGQKSLPTISIGLSALRSIRSGRTHNGSTSLIATASFASLTRTAT
jgi:glucose/arabinose dehydrogenase